MSCYMILSLVHEGHSTLKAIFFLSITGSKDQTRPQTLLAAGMWFIVPMWKQIHQASFTMMVWHLVGNYYQTANCSTEF